LLYFSYFVSQRRSGKFRVLQCPKAEELTSVDALGMDVVYGAAQHGQNGLFPIPPPFIHYLWYDATFIIIIISSSCVTEKLGMGFKFQAASYHSLVPNPNAGMLC